MHLSNESKQIRIVFLYTVVVHYVVAVLRALKNINPNIQIILVYYDKRGSSKVQYEIPKVNGVLFLARSRFNKSALYDLLITEDPTIIYISGWVDKDYLWAVKRFKSDKKKTIVITGIDDQWFGTLRQHLGIIYYKLFYKKIFDFFWVAGKPQYHYAQRFGLQNNRIITNLLSADDEIFSEKSVRTKRFVFLGRFVEVKGIDILLTAYNQLADETRKNWPLVLIGDGPLREYIESHTNQYIQLVPFLQPKELKVELSKGGVLCLPSRKDAWGLVVHELALIGYPLILSSACGAATEFLISGYNGFLFQSNSIDSLRKSLMLMTTLSDEDLELFSKRSSLLGSRINPEISAHSLLSVLTLAEI